MYKSATQPGFIVVQKPGSKCFIKVKSEIKNSKSEIVYMNTITIEKETAQTATDFLPLQGTDYVEFYVGNAKQAG